MQDFDPSPERWFILTSVTEDMVRFGRRLTPEHHDEVYGHGAYEARYGQFDDPAVELERAFDAHFGQGAYRAYQPESRGRPSRAKSRLR